jgi:hypothetical protein
MAAESHVALATVTVMLAGSPDWNARQQTSTPPALASTFHPDGGVKVSDVVGLLLPVMKDATVTSPVVVPVGRLAVMLVAFGFGPVDVLRTVMAIIGSRQK